MEPNEEFDEIEVTLPDDNIKRDSSISRQRLNFKKSTLFNPLYCADGKVIESHDDGLVDVQLSNGMKLGSVQVISTEWAGATATKAYGRKDMPPKNSKVVVLFIGGVIENAFIIGSMLSHRGGVGSAQKTHIIKDGETRKDVRVTEFGWKETYDKDTGKFILEDINPGALFKITVDVSGKKIEVIDHNNNKTTYDANGIKHEDINGNTFKMISGKVTINENFEVNQ